MAFINTRVDDIVMQNVRILVGATLIAAALISGLNVLQVAHAQDTCAVGSNLAGNPTSNKQSGGATTGPAGATSGNPHCFDTEQQLPSATNPAGDTTVIGTCVPTTGTCGNHPQSTNPNGAVIGNPHEEPIVNNIGSGCPVGQAGPCNINPQNSVVGSPHYPTR
jgi:hypothetical protein